MTGSGAQPSDGEGPRQLGLAACTPAGGSPIFLFAAGWRSGSTLLQRLITATGRVLIWGEGGGAIECFARAEKRYEQMLGPGSQRYDEGLGGNGAAQYQEFKDRGADGVHLWIPCMNAPMERIHGGFRELMSAIYEVPARELGYGRWGLKEVKATLESARFVRRIFPAARIVFLIRNPIDCLASLKRHRWMDRPDDPKALEYYARHWTRLASEYRSAEFGRMVRYEDLVRDASSVASLMEFLKLPAPPADFLRASHAKGGASTGGSLSRWELLRARRIVNAEMRHHGY